MHERRRGALARTHIGRYLVLHRRQVFEAYAHRVAPMLMRTLLALAAVAPGAPPYMHHLLREVAALLGEEYQIFDYTQLEYCAGNLYQTNY